jgi:hypothetical protein
MAFLLDPNGLTEVKAPARGSPPRGAGTPPQAVPMTVTAEKAVRFLAAANQVLFEGDCKATLLRSEPNVTYEYTLTAPRLVLDVASDPNSHKKKELAVAARKLATDGGPALLHIWRRASDKVLGETELHAAQLQYEVEPFASAAPGVMPARGAQFTAVGPGAIWIRNDEMVNRQADPNQFSLGRPCVARVTNFDTLKYFTATNRIVADNEAQQLLLDYFPLVDGKYSGQHTRTVAGHLEASLQEVTKGHLELATLTATKGVYYEDETKKVSFSGASLSYDYSQSLVAIRGDAQQPCLLNGARVNHIDLNLKTGRLQAEPAGGVIQVQR